MDAARDNPGRFVGRDISAGEKVEAELTAIIERRRDRCVVEEERLRRRDYV